MLQYTQLKFKLDLLMKPYIPGSIPSRVTNLWTLSDPRACVTSFLNEKKMWVDFRVLENLSPRRNGFSLESPLTFYFYFFLNGENEIRTKTPH